MNYKLFSFFPIYEVKKKLKNHYLLVDLRFENHWQKSYFIDNKLTNDEKEMKEKRRQDIINPKYFVNNEIQLFISSPLFDGWFRSPLCIIVSSYILSYIIHDVKCQWITFRPLINGWPHLTNKFRSQTVILSQSLDDPF